MYLPLSHLLQKCTGDCMYEDIKPTRVTYWIPSCPVSSSLTSPSSIIRQVKGIVGIDTIVMYQVINLCCLVTSSDVCSICCFGTLANICEEYRRKSSELTSDSCCHSIRRCATPLSSVIGYQLISPLICTYNNVCIKLYNSRQNRRFDPSTYHATIKSFKMLWFVTPMCIY